MALRVHDSLRKPLRGPFSGTVSVACACVLFFAHAVHAQNQQRGGGLPQPIGQPVAGQLDDNTAAADMAEQERLLRYLNAQRQKSIVSDTNKLLKLASELESEIDHDNPAALSQAQLHKIAEIEKLAHSVKDKMSTSVRGIPGFQQHGPLVR